MQKDKRQIKNVSHTSLNNMVTGSGGGGGGETCNI
jgi:hypothetical protein